MDFVELFSDDEIKELGMEISKNKNQYKNNNINYPPKVYITEQASKEVIRLMLRQ